tara:strand:- start:608 stop:1531 length:924 start_codon:yes stop_codon:yes gene_type:complete
MDKLWISHLVEWFEQIEETDYQWSLSGYDTCKLSSSSLFCKLATIYKGHYDFNEDRMVQIINSYRQDDGMFKDIDGHKNIIAESRQAMSGLYNLGYEIGEFNISNYFPKPLFFMNDGSWSNPWDAGAQLSHYLFFNAFKGDEDEVQNILSSIEKYEHNDGWYSSRPNDNVLINGIMKVFTGFDIIGYRLDDEYMKGILDFVLNSHSSTGGCNVYDYVYVLAKCIEYDYRTTEAKSELLKIYDDILTYQQSDGGFSYGKDSTQTTYYGQSITPGHKVGGIHGTTLFSMALSKIDNALDLGLGLNLAVS